MGTPSIEPLTSTVTFDTQHRDPKVGPLICHQVFCSLRPTIGAVSPVKSVSAIS